MISSRRYLSNKMKPEEVHPQTKLPMDKTGCNLQGDQKVIAQGLNVFSRTYSMFEKVGFCWRTIILHHPARTTTTTMMMMMIIIIITILIVITLVIIAITIIILIMITMMMKFIVPGCMGFARSWTCVASVWLASMKMWTEVKMWMYLCCTTVSK